jgi:paraquat-inducible protein B
MSVTQQTPGISPQARAGFIGVLAALLFGYGMSALIAWQRHREAGQPYHIIFNRVEGIQTGTEIWMKGQLVGHVRRLDVTPDGRADVTIAIQRRGVVLTRESKYDIQNMLFGERWLRIQPEGETVIEPGGTAYGEGPERFSRILRNGLNTFAYVEQTARKFQGQFGSTSKARGNLNKMLAYYNDMAFDMRVQANRFNQFSGLITQQIDKMAAGLDQKVAASREQADVMALQMKLYARKMKLTAASSGNKMHGMLAGMSEQAQAMNEGMKAGDIYVGTQVKKTSAMLGQLHKAREQLDKAADLVGTLKLITHNPRLIEQFKKQIHDMHGRTTNMRQGLEKMQNSKLLKKAIDAQAASPSPSPSPSPGVRATPSPSPSPAAQPTPSPSTLPAAH